MKIAIITLPLYSNYGGILQNFALQQTVRKMGGVVEDLNIEFSDVSLVSRLKGSVISLVNALTGKADWRKVVSPYATEKMRWLRRGKELTKSLYPSIAQSPLLYTERQILKYVQATDFDAYIVGSDQVWRPNYLPNVKWYYLGFLPKNSRAKRIAYAASFGTDEWEYTPEQTLQVAPLARLFDAISVREEAGVKLCNDYLGVKAKTVIDPTMLLSVDEYQAQVDSALNSTYSVRDCVFSYVLDNTERKQRVLSEIAAILEIPVQRLAYNNRQYLKSVNQWLRGFSESTCVVTDSFPGTVFSILFHRPFVVIANKGRGLSRIETLLKTFGLEERLVESAEQITQSWLVSSIDWRYVDEILKKKRIEAMEFLSSALNFKV